MGRIRMLHNSVRKLQTIGGRLIGQGAHSEAIGGASCNIRGPWCISRAAPHDFLGQRPFQQTASHSSCIVGHSPVIIWQSVVQQQQQQHQRQQVCCHHQPLRRSPQSPRPSGTLPTRRQLSSRKPDKPNKKKAYENAPLLNEHLIAELFNKKKPDVVPADSYEVRLIVDRGRIKKTDDDDDDDDGAEDDDAAPPTTTQVTTIEQAIGIAHEHGLDLMEVTLQQNPPVIKAVNFDRWLYEQKKKERQATSRKKKEGGGAISDRPLKEFKFRAGIADHDLRRKTDNMIKYLGKGHAIRVTLNARKRMLMADEQAIYTTLERVKELVGDRAVEVRALKANDRKSYGSLLFHPNKA